MTNLRERESTFRSTIAAFIETRREAKLKGNEDDAGTASKYDYEPWLAEAAKRAGAIQLATHPIKATFTDAKIKETTSPLVQGHELPRHLEIGSHLIEYDIIDGTGDAASLGTFKLLVEVFVEGKPLIYWLLNDDPDLLSVLGNGEGKADKISADLKRIIRKKQAPASHYGAKQVYWLIGDKPADETHYQLLQPMFSSSLAHVVHAEIQDARFGEDNKLARQAWRAKESHERAYRDYRHLLARKLGGTKPQNVSQLNSERGGVNYLLASLPPTWTMDRPRKLLDLASAMDRLVYYRGVRRLIKTLAEFLLGIPPANEATRETRKRIEQELGTELALFAAETWARFEPGWTRSPDCLLPLCEKLWLDPERTELPVRKDPEHPEREQDDLAFNAAYELGNWADEVAGNFANWVNARLRDAGLTTVGDSEYRHWAKQAIVDAAWPVPMQRRAPAGGAK